MPTHIQPLAIAIAIVLAWPSLADEIELKDGRVLTGTVTARREGLVWFRHRKDGLMTDEVFVESLDVVRIEIDQPTPPPPIDEVSAPTPPPPARPTAPQAEVKPAASFDDPVAFTAPSGRAATVRFSPDADRLGVASVGYVAVWDLPSNRPVFEIRNDPEVRGHWDDGGAMVTSEGPFARRGSDRSTPLTQERRIRRDPVTGRPLADRRDLGPTSPNRRLVAMPVAANLSRLFPSGPGGPPAMPRPQPAPGDEHAVSIWIKDARTDATLHTLRTRSHRAPSEVRAGELDVELLVFTPDSTRVVALLKDGSVNLWSLAAPTQVTVITLPPNLRTDNPTADGGHRAHWLADGHTLALRRARSGRLELIDIQTGLVQVALLPASLEYGGPDGPNTGAFHADLHISPDARYLIDLLRISPTYTSRPERPTRDGDLAPARGPAEQLPPPTSVIAVYDRVGAREVGRIACPRHVPVASVSFSGDSRRVAIGLSDGRVIAMPIDALLDAARRGGPLPGL